MKTANGWMKLSGTLKYKPYVNAEHEFMMSVGVVRNFARTGATGSNGATLGNDDSSSTRPTFYFGKGFGDLPIGWARAFAITGELSYQIADKKLKVTAPIRTAAILYSTMAPGTSGPAACRCNTASAISNRR